MTHFTKTWPIVYIIDPKTCSGNNHNNNNNNDNSSSHSLVSNIQSKQLQLLHNVNNYNQLILMVKITLSLSLSPLSLSLSQPIPIYHTHTHTLSLHQWGGSTLLSLHQSQESRLGTHYLSSNHDEANSTPITLLPSLSLSLSLHLSLLVRSKQSVPGESMAVCHHSCLLWSRQDIIIKVINNK